MNDVILLGLAGAAVLALLLIVRSMRASNQPQTAGTAPAETATSERTDSSDD